MDLLYSQIARYPAIVPERPVYLLFGREQVLLEDALTKLLAGVRQTAGAEPDVQVFYGSGATAEQVWSELSNLSLLGMGKVVVIREAQRMRAAEQGRLAELVPRLGSGSLLILMAGEAMYDSRARKRKVLAEKLESAVRSAGVTIEAPAFREQDAERWVLVAARDAGVTMDPQAAAQMVLLAGADLSRLRNELAKAIAYAGPAARITADDVAAVVSRSPEATVFELVDAIGDRKPARALTALKVLMDGGEPEQRILALIARQIRLIWQTKYLAENGYVKRTATQVPPEVVRDLLPRDGSLSVMASLQRPFMREKLLRQANAFSWSGLRRGLERVLMADLAFKGIEGDVDNPRLVLEMLVLELASRGSEAAVTTGQEH